MITKKQKSTEKCRQIPEMSRLYINQLPHTDSETDELETDPAKVETFLKKNFLMNYNSTKAPFGLHVHYSWFLASQEVRETGYRK